MYQCNLSHVTNYINILQAVSKKLFHISNNDSTKLSTSAPSARKMVTLSGNKSNDDNVGGNFEILEGEPSWGLQREMRKWKGQLESGLSVLSGRLRREAVGQERVVREALGQITSVVNGLERFSIRYEGQNDDNGKTNGK